MTERVLFNGKEVPIINPQVIQKSTIEVLKEIRQEIDELISRPKGYMKEVYEMGKDNAYENVLKIIDKHIKEIEGDTE